MIIPDGSGEINLARDGAASNVDHHALPEANIVDPRSMSTCTSPCSFASKHSIDQAKRVRRGEVMHQRPIHVFSDRTTVSYGGRCGLTETAVGVDAQNYLIGGGKRLEV